MLKQIFAYILASVLLIYCAKYMQYVLVKFEHFYTYCAHLTSPIFSHTGMGLLCHQILLLVCIPVLIIAIPASLYRLIKGENMPHFIGFVWTIWLSLVFAILLH